jgi:hypothetical protein
MPVNKLFGKPLTKPKVVIKPLEPPDVDSVATPIVDLEAVVVLDCASWASLLPPVAPAR